MHRALHGVGEGQEAVVLGHEPAGPIDRMKEFYQNQQRERAKREAAEAVKERDRAAVER